MSLVTGGVSVAENLERVKARLAAAAGSAGRRAEDVAIVGASKTVAPERIAEAVRAGLRHIGENRVQEAAPKRQALRGLEAPVTWHMIGHLQTNKVKQALETFDVIQSIDSVKLGEAIARRAGRQAPVLLEVNMAEEATKSGFAPAEVEEAARLLRALPELKVMGLMTVAPMADDPEAVRPVFRRLREIRDVLGLRELSMGMSEDFEVAVQEGSTMVRIGRAIFGERPA